MEIEVCFQPSGTRVRVPPGTLLLDAARRAGLPVGTGCDAHGFCGRCGVTILRGDESVSTETAREIRSMRCNRIDPSQRLSCLVSAFGDVEITASYW